MKINFTVRFKNPMFWMQLALSIFTPIAAYFGLTGSDFTTWELVIQTFVNALSNPYVCILVLVSVWNAINDPTTYGIGDSSRALTYASPASDK